MMKMKTPVVLAAMAVTLFTLATTAQATVSTAQNYQMLTLGAYGKCLQVYDTPGEGARLTAVDCTGAVSQQFFYDPVSNVIRGWTNYCLSTLDGTQNNGVPVVMKACAGVSTQKWYKDANFFYSAVGRCLTHNNSFGYVQDPPQHRGGGVFEITTWECVNGANQSWVFSPVGRPYHAGAIIGMNGKCVDAAAFSHDNGTQMQMWDCLDGVNQKFTYDPATGLIRVYGDKCLTAATPQLRNGDRVQLQDCWGVSNQKWTVYPSGQIKIGNNKCLEIYAFGLDNGAQLGVWDCVDGVNQTFTIEGI